MLLLCHVCNLCQHLALLSTMPEIVGVKISIKVEGATLPEYDTRNFIDDVLQVPVTTCWIPSDVGKVSLRLSPRFRLLQGYQAFSITIAYPNRPCNNHWCAGIILDGLKTNVLGASLNKFSPQATWELSHAVVSTSTTRPLQFGTLRLTGEFFTIISCGDR